MSGLSDAYITGIGAYLPGPPVSNDDMENHIGRIAGRDAVMGRRALRWNGIKTRHYALDAGGAMQSRMQECPPRLS